MKVDWMELQWDTAGGRLHSTSGERRDSNQEGHSHSVLYSIEPCSVRGELYDEHTMSFL